MPIVKLNIDNNYYKVECADGEENILRIAEQKINSEIKNHPEFRSLPDSKKFLMISLLMASDENKIKNIDVESDLKSIDEELGKLEIFLKKINYVKK